MVRPPLVLAVKNGAHILRDGSKKLAASMTSLLKQDVLVGIPQDGKDKKEGEPPIGDNAREAEAPNEPAPAITNAVIGYLNEYGAPEMNIPPRPFLLPGVKNAQANITKRMEKAAKAGLDGDQAGVIREMNKAGLDAQSAVRMKIKQGPFQELAAPTLAARRRRGHASEKPLQESGQLRNAVVFIIRNKK